MSGAGHIAATRIPENDMNKVRISKFCVEKAFVCLGWHSRASSAGAYCAGCECIQERQPSGNEGNSLCRDIGHVAVVDSI